MMAGALRHAPASTVAPVQYFEIPFAVLWGWLLFAELPNGLALVGIAIVMAAGLYIILRERRARTASARPSPPQEPPAAG